MTMYLGFSGSINNSLQVGDVVYYVNTSDTGGFTSGDGPGEIGTIENIQTNDFNSGILSDFYTTTDLTLAGQTPDFLITINEVNPFPSDAASLWDPNDPNDDGLGSSDDFIMFSKNNKHHSSSVKGYYADIKFSNNSTVKSEMFAASCGYEESSK